MRCEAPICPAAAAPDIATRCHSTASANRPSSARAMAIVTATAVVLCSTSTARARASASRPSRPCGSGDAARRRAIASGNAGSPG